MKRTQAGASNRSLDEMQLAQISGMVLDTQRRISCARLPIARRTLEMLNELSGTQQTA